MVEEEEKRFRVGRIVGREDEPDTRAEPPRRSEEPVDDADDSDVARDRQRQPPERDYAHLDIEREAGFGPGGRFGAAVAASSFVLLILLYLLPWLQQDGSALSRADVRQGTLDANVDYLSRLTTMPVWGLVMAGLGAAGLLVADLRARTAGQYALIVVPLAGAGLYGAFLIVLATARLFGYWFSRLLDADPAGFHPHVVPWLLAAAGVSLGLLFLGRLRSAWEAMAAIATDAWTQTAERWAHRTVFVAAGALVALPLLPLASDFGAEPSHVSEAGFFAATGPFSFVVDSVEDTAGALELVHLMLWLTIGVSVVTLAVAAVERLGWIERKVRDPLLQGFLLNVVFWVVLVVTMMLLYTTYIPNVQFSFGLREDYAPALNHVLPAALLLLGWTIGRYVMRVTVPYARGVASTSAPSDVSPNHGS